MDSERRPGKVPFACTRCGDCCNGYGGTYLSESDIDAIARFLGVSRESMVLRYTRLSGDRALILQGADGYCVFWDQVCTIHPVKPRMCRRWPFIDALLVDPDNWRSMASCCPGMDADAPQREILAWVTRVLKP